MSLLSHCFQAQFLARSVICMVVMSFSSQSVFAQNIPITDPADLKKLAEARLLENQGHIDAALPVAQALSKKYPRSSLAWKLQGDCLFFSLMTTHSPAEARFCAERALALAPDDSSCFQLMADIENESGHFARAAMFATKGLEHKPIDARNYRARSSAMTNLHKYEEAYADYCTYLNLKPELAKNRRNKLFKATIAESAGHFQDSLDIYSNLQKERYGDQIPPLQAAIMIKMHKNAEALNILNELISKIPNDDMGLIARAKLFESMGRIPDAVKDYTSAIAIDDEASYYIARANLYDKLGQKEKAAQDRKSASTVNPF